MLRADFGHLPRSPLLDSTFLARYLLWKTAWLSVWFGLKKDRDKSTKQIDTDHGNVLYGLFSRPRQGYPGNASLGKEQAF